MDVCDKICYFFIMNILFLLSNIPVLLFFLFIGISQVRTCLPLFLICCIPIPLALSAIFYSMYRLLNQTESTAIKDYLHGYQMDIGQKSKLALGQSIVILILWTNVEFFAKQLVILPFVILFAILFAFAILMTPMLYLLASRYQMTNKELIKTACILTCTRPILTLGNLAALFIILMSIEIMAGTTVLFMASIYGFLVVLMSRKMLQSLEENR